MSVGWSTCLVYKRKRLSLSSLSSVPIFTDIMCSSTSARQTRKDDGKKRKKKFRRSPRYIPRTVLYMCSRLVTGSDYPFGKARAGTISLAAASFLLEGSLPRLKYIYIKAEVLLRGLTSCFPPHFTGDESRRRSAL